MTIIESLNATCDLLDEKLPGKFYWIERRNGMCRLVEGSGKNKRSISVWMDTLQTLSDWVAPYYQGVCAVAPAEHIEALAQDRADLGAI